MWLQGARILGKQTSHLLHGGQKTDEWLLGAGSVIVKEYEGMFAG